MHIASLKLPTSQSEIMAHWCFKDKIYVSFVCLSFNHEEYITDAINGMLAQKTEYKFEIVIHDDLSTDRTREILQKYKREFPDIIKLVLQKENQYSLGRRITPIATKYASGVYIALCEGDDFWTDDDKIQKQVSFLESDTDYIISYHDTMVINSDKELIKKSKIPQKFKKDISESSMALGDSFLPTMSWVYRNLNFGNYDEINKVLNGDTFFVSMLSLYGKAKFHSCINSAYRLHEQGIWSSKIAKVKNDQLANTLFWMMQFHEKKQSPYASLLRLKNFRLVLGNTTRDQGIAFVLFFLFKNFSQKLYCKLLSRKLS